jgi:hypothetical protein
MRSYSHRHRAGDPLSTEKILGLPADGGVPIYGVGVLFHRLIVCVRASLLLSLDASFPRERARCSLRRCSTHTMPRNLRASERSL